MPVRLSELPAATLPLDGSELLALVQSGGTCAAAVSAVANSGLAYEVGTWTPTLYGSGTAGAPTYASNKGRYVLIGSVVYISFWVQLSTKGGLAGHVRMDGLPFTVKAAIEARSGVNLGLTGNHILAAGTVGIGSLGMNNTTNVYFYRQTLTSGSYGLQDTEIDDDFTVYGSGFYEVA